MSIDLRKAAIELRDKANAEQATGLSENPHGLGTIYDDSGEPLTEQWAIRDQIESGNAIEIPNAGSGSYNTVFTDAIGYDECKVVDWTSSAGDWCFAVRKGDEWYIAFQRNRYPYHGFMYSVDISRIFYSYDEILMA